jgi:hypothetical protein
LNEGQLCGWQRSAGGRCDAKACAGGRGEARAGCRERIASGSTYAEIAECGDPILRGSGQRACKAAAAGKCKGHWVRG